MRDPKADDLAYRRARLAQMEIDLPEGVDIANPRTLLHLAKQTCDLLLITPAMAKKWLEDNNPNNRKLSDRRIAEGVEAMYRGEWGQNGQTISFDVDGNLTDGQHRLAIIEAANMAAWCWVVRGVEREALFNSDTGVIRKLKDMFYILEKDSPEALAATVAWLWRWQNNRMVGSGNRKVPTIQQGIATYNENPNIEQSLAYGRKAGNALRTGRHPLAMLHYVLSDIDAEDTEYFYDRVADGQALLEGDPIHTLRRTITNLVAKGSSSRQPVSGEYVCALTIKAWNGYRMGRQDMQHLSWRRGGKNPEPFPDPIVDPM